MATASLIVGRDKPQINEAVAIEWLNATGVIGLGLIVSWLAWQVAELRRSPVWPTTLALVAALATGSWLVPYLGLFPISAFVFSGLALTASAHAASSARPPASVPAPAGARAAREPAPLPLTPGSSRP